MAASNPSLLEKIDLIPAALSLVGSAIYHGISGPFRGQLGADTYKHHITHAVVRRMLSRFSTAQLQYISAPFSQIYEVWCKKNNVTPNKVLLNTGTEAFWVGDPKAEYVVIYYHGGGFSLDGGPEHIAFWGSDVYADLKTAGKSVSFLFLQYTLVPHGTYPVQVKEAIESVRYLTQDMKRSASTIILAGDSAGGNMCLAVLSQAMHPSPDLPKVDIDTPFKALVLIAPWVRFEGHTASVANNLYKDIVSPEVGSKWSEDYLAGTPTNPYTEPANADASWWKDPRVEHIVCVVGGDELLCDSVSEWATKYKSVNGAGSITFVIGENEVHIAPLIEPRAASTASSSSSSGLRKLGIATRPSKWSRKATTKITISALLPDSSPKRPSSPTHTLSSIIDAPDPRDISAQYFGSSSADSSTAEESEPVAARTWNTSSEDSSDSEAGVLPVNSDPSRSKRVEQQRRLAYHHTRSEPAAENNISSDDEAFSEFFKTCAEAAGPPPPIPKRSSSRRLREFGALKRDRGGRLASTSLSYNQRQKIFPPEVTSAEEDDQKPWPQSHEPEVIAPTPLSPALPHFHTIEEAEVYRQSQDSKHTSPSSRALAKGDEDFCGDEGSQREFASQIHSHNDYRSFSSSQSSLRLPDISRDSISNSSSGTTNALTAARTSTASLTRSYEGDTMQLHLENHGPCTITDIDTDTDPSLTKIQSNNSSAQSDTEEKTGPRHATTLQGQRSVEKKSQLQLQSLDPDVKERQDWYGREVRLRVERIRRALRTKSFYSGGII
ncbi:hypothetical protein DV737_g4290, partial [Chaetothyriales sp. CBS 132003]